eukprot:2149464-Amphidinium_carterae.1
MILTANGSGCRLEVTSSVQRTKAVHNHLGMSARQGKDRNSLPWSAHCLQLQPGLRPAWLKWKETSPMSNLVTGPTP